MPDNTSIAQNSGSTARPSTPAPPVRTDENTNINTALMNPQPATGIAAIDNALMDMQSTTGTTLMNLQPATGIAAMDIALANLESTTDYTATPLFNELAFHGTEISTFGDLLSRLRFLRVTLSAEQFLPVFQEAQTIVGATFGPIMDQTAEIMVAFEELGIAHVAGFREYTQNGNYKDQQPNFHKARNNRDINKSSAASARMQVPARYPKHGAALVLHSSTQHFHRSLKTLTNKFLKEEDGIAAVNRIIIERVKRGRASQHGLRGRTAVIALTVSDLDTALSLAHREWSPPTAEEIAEHGLYIDQTLGTLTSIPQAEQTYAETVVGSTPTTTPQRQPRPQLSFFTPVSQIAPAISHELGHRAQDEPLASNPGVPNPLTNTANSPAPVLDYLNSIVETGARSEPNPNQQALDGSDPEENLESPSSAEEEYQDEEMADAGQAVPDEEILGEDPPSPKGPCACIASETLTSASISTITEAARKARPNGRVSSINHQSRLDLLQQLRDPLLHTKDDPARMCPEHIRAVSNAVGLANTQIPVLINRLCHLANHSSNNDMFHAITHRNARTSLWFTQPVFEHDLYDQFHHHYGGVELQMPQSPEEWDKLVQDLVHHFPTLKDDPRSTLAANGYVDIPFHNPHLQTKEIQKLFATENSIIAHHTSITGGVRWARQHSIAQQVAAQDIGRYLIDVLLRPDHPHELISYPEPVLETHASDIENKPQPFSIPLPMHRPQLFTNSLTSLVSQMDEKPEACDSYLHGVGGTLQAFEEFRGAYVEYLEGKDGSLSRRFGHDIDAANFCHQYANVYSTSATPLPGPKSVRFLLPWLPRAHRGRGSRLVFQSTLVAPREAIPTDPDFLTGKGNITDVRVDGGEYLDDLLERNASMTAGVVGPWGNRHPLRRNALRKVCGNKLGWASFHVYGHAQL